MIIIAATVIIIDPFFHYHSPILGLKRVQTLKEYQVNGILANTEYNAILAGSSVTVNINTDIFNDNYNCITVKAAAGSARTSTLWYYIEKAYDYQDLDYVFYGLDIFALYTTIDRDSTQDQILYLRDNNPINDVYYLWNIDVLFKHIPYMIAESYFHEYDEGVAYNFSTYSAYGTDYALNSYKPQGEILPMKDISDYCELVYANVGLLEETIGNHPETEFKFFFPVYSCLWWDRSYRSGEMEQYFWAMEYVYDILGAYDNVEFYKGTFNDWDSVMNLNNYSDLTHASYDINQLQAYSITTGEGLIEDKERLLEEINILRTMIYDFEDRLAQEGNWEFLYNEYAQ